MSEALKFTAQDYATLYDIVFKEDYPGYKPNVLELPNGDGKVDAEKRYAHVAVKYLATDRSKANRYFTLKTYLEKCHRRALEVAIELGVPREFWPDINTSALRVLEYPPGADSNLHTDFDLFTLNLYRNLPDSLSAGDTLYASELPEDVHAGELLYFMNPTKWEPTPHEVFSNSATQYSLVYFAIPNHKAVLPTGQTVGEWIEERISRSRAYV